MNTKWPWLAIVNKSYALHNLMCLVRSNFLRYAPISSISSSLNSLRSCNYFTSISEDMAVKSWIDIALMYFSWFLSILVWIWSSECLRPFTKNSAWTISPESLNTNFSSYIKGKEQQLSHTIDRNNSPIQGNIVIVLFYNKYWNIYWFNTFLGVIRAYLLYSRFS